MKLDDERALDEIRIALQDFLARRGRDLPWRKARTPYRVLVSEVMLQQTRAETVRHRYVRWLQRFPGWRELAAASRDEVLLEWRGLGYYARARNLHRTARIVCERHGGQLPTEAQALKALPGVGDYTAGAVASIAFGRPVAAVDGNVRRVLCRLLDWPDPAPSVLRDAAARLLHPTRPGHHNEAMMELGATVCTPRSPRCPLCPVRSRCAAHRLGTVSERPLRRPRRSPRQLDIAVAVAFNRTGMVLLVRRPAEGLLGGMWEFPSNANLRRWEFPSNANLRRDQAPSGAALDRLAELGLDGVASGVLPTVRHAFTHLRVRYRPVVVRVRGSEAAGRTGTFVPGSGGARLVPAPRPSARESSAETETSESRSICWADPADLDAFALPVAQQKIAALVREGLPADTDRPAPG